MRTELIVATYQNPHALALCLASVARQGTPPDSIAIADDGSGPETAAVIADAMHASDVPIRHVWHPDTGFQKNAILNRAIATSDADFLVFIDGDVLIRPDFLDHHRRLARPDRWSSGSLIRLDAAATQAVSAEIVTSGRSSPAAGCGTIAPSTGSVPGSRRAPCRCRRSHSPTA